VAQALVEGRIIKTYAFRGATQLMAPEDAGVYLALRASSRMWELPSWQSYYRLAPSDWRGLRKAVRDALTDGPMTKQELKAAVTSHAPFRHLGFAFSDQVVTLLKPLAWLGEMRFGPPRDGRATFQRLDRNPRWAGLPNLDEAGRRAIEAYLRAYGPATLRHLHYWLGEGLGAGKRIKSWLAALTDGLATVDVEGVQAYILREHFIDLTETPATTTVRLLPGYDQWALGPGTSDRHIVPPDLRPQISRGANFVAVGGVVSGTWSLTDDGVTITWSGQRMRAPKQLINEELSRLSTIFDRPLRWKLEHAQ
jgi:hypothetical protein